MSGRGRHGWRSRALRRTAIYHSTSARYWHHCYCSHHVVVGGSVAPPYKKRDPDSSDTGPCSMLKRPLPRSVFAGVRRTPATAVPDVMGLTRRQSQPLAWEPSSARRIDGSSPMRRSCFFTLSPFEPAGLIVGQPCTCGSSGQVSSITAIASHLLLASPSRQITHANRRSTDSRITRAKPRPALGEHHPLRKGV